MLVLSRNPGESIILTCPDGTQLKVKAIEVRKGNQMRLGFEAPPTVRIDREEIHIKRQEEGKS